MRSADRSALWAAHGRGGVLRVDGLYVSFGMHRVLEGIDLAIPFGEVHGVVGRNGAGKSTLLTRIAGLGRCDRGEISADGLPLRSRDLSYLPVTPHLYSHITGREYLSLFDPHPARPDSRSAREEWADAWGAAFAIPLDELIDSYSSGMRQKLAIVGMLRLDRPVLILDEPGNALDLESNQLLSQVLRSIARAGAAVVLTSHVLESLDSVCDQVHVLEGGVIGASYRQAELPQLRASLAAEATQRLEALTSLLHAPGSSRV